MANYTYAGHSNEFLVIVGTFLTAALRVSEECLASYFYTAAAKEAGLLVLVFDCPEQSARTRSA